MSLTLTSRDLQQLTTALQLLVSPLDHASVDHWRSAVNRHLKELLHADSAGFLLPVEDGLMMFSEEHDPAELARYQDFPPPPLIDGTPLWEYSIQAQVMTLEEGYGRNYDRYLNSAYYQDYAGANSAHDTLCASVSLGGLDARGMACLNFWHGTPNGKSFGRREVSLLKLLYPAFQAGCEAQARWGSQRCALLEALDALGSAVAIYDFTGAQVHRTPALEGALRLDPEAGRIECELRALVDDLTRSQRRRDRDPVDAAAFRHSVTMRTTFAKYELRASLYGLAQAGSMPVILVALDRLTPVPIAEAELRSQFNLTRAEVRVATRIAHGRTNAAIADELCISPHTVRRHTEKILMKLRVESRSEVAARLLR